MTRLYCLDGGRRVEGLGKVLKVGHGGQEGQGEKKQGRNWQGGLHTRSGSQGSVGTAGSHLDVNDWWALLSPLG